ncbi:hypothetical protein CD30_01495 [Ureibacillus massiliensis 4400831 = CIP 108448 = CCUG 49529]|uniref:Uncharacterized protein n=1 Tax=Ureibacillus massiliensis 4400831 = CIP 108448 = CCUG 49529 TaxID=1211035 RepID=A0A0A3JBD2_9BACL|nr:hypothetical protein CD30_01495 [Ureibacillus massiliensis 4400831 = CIP 108448 = CCUG 49529]
MDHIIDSLEHLVVGLGRLLDSFGQIDFFRSFGLRFGSLKVIIERIALSFFKRVFFGAHGVLIG